MYSLIVSTVGWDETSGTQDASRVLEYTPEDLRQRFKPNGVLDLAALKELPAILASETDWENSQAPARVATITRATLSRLGREVQLEYVLDPDIAPIPNSVLTSVASELQIDVKGSIHEFQRNHWSVKNVDLFKVLFKRGLGMRPKPKVFALGSAPQEPNLVAVMMPFDTAFKPVQKALTKAATDAGMTLLRADDIWINDHIMQDVITLLCQAKVVICDLTGHNANVFYEMGIAHMLPRDVIMITQETGKIPFDISPIRHIKYLNNREGLKKLAAEVTARLETLKAQ